MVTRLGQINHEVMEPRLLGDTQVTYIEKTIGGYEWRCDGCGLVWAKKWHAETCEARGHASTFVQKYGGYVENGRHKGGAQYTRQAIRRDKLGD